MTVLEMLLRPENAPELWLMLVCVGLAVVGFTAIAVDAVRRGRHPTYRVPSLEPRCERVGSQQEFARRLRARG